MISQKTRVQQTEIKRTVVKNMLQWAFIISSVDKLGRKLWRSIQQHLHNSWAKYKKCQICCQLWTQIAGYHAGSTCNRITFTVSALWPQSRWPPSLWLRWWHILPVTLHTPYERFGNSTAEFSLSLFLRLVSRRARGKMGASRNKVYN